MRDTIIERVLDAVRDGQVLPDATIRTWQSSATGKFHADDTCGRRHLAVVVDHRALDLDGLAAHGEDAFCRQCTGAGWNQPNPWCDWLTVSDAIATADRWLAPGGRPFDDVGRVSLLLGNLRRYAERTDPVLADACRERARLLVEWIDTFTATATPGRAARLATLERACHHLPRYWTVPIPVDGHHRDDRTVVAYVCPPVVGEYSHAEQCHPVHHACWFAFVTEIVNGAPCVAAVETAVRAAADSAAGVVAPWDKTPSATRFPAGRFAHPVDWANAEWRAAAVDECRELAEGRARRCDEAAARGDVTIVLTGFDSAGGAELVSDAAVRLVTPSQCATTGRVMFANVPAAVADWLTVLAGDYHRDMPRLAGPNVVVLADHPTPVEVLKIATAIFDPGSDGELADPRAALQAAHHLTAG